MCDQSVLNLIAINSNFGNKLRALLGIFKGCALALASLILNFMGFSVEDGSVVKNQTTKSNPFIVTLRKVITYLSTAKN